MCAFRAAPRRRRQFLIIVGPPIGATVTIEAGLRRRTGAVGGPLSSLGHLILDRVVADLGRCRTR